jgi:sugar/nucleoside kinase (ribokinase family)
MNKYDVLCVGNYTKDTIVSPAGTRYVDGGAVNYAAHAARRLGADVAVVMHLSQEDDRVVEKLATAGIDCFPTYVSSSTLMKLEYPTTDPDIRTLTVTDTAGSITAGEVEKIDARAAIIGTSLRGEVGLDVIQALKAKGMRVALDVQGFARVLRGAELRYEPWDEMAAILELVDILKSDAVEAEFLTGESEISRAARSYSSMGPREVVLTHKDGLLVHANGSTHDLSFYPARLDGRSGRGDTCIGIYALKRLTLDPREAGIWAAAVTSLKMETLGPFNRSVGEVEAFIHEKYNHGSIR